MKYISDLISKIDLNIEASKRAMHEATDHIERLKLVKESIQALCSHRNPDGSDAFEEYATTHNRSLQRCSICQKEITV